MLMMNQPERQRLTQLCGKLYGRQAEIEQLHEVLRRARNSNEKTQVALVAGDGGVGKSALLSEVFHDSKRCLHGTGKFEQERRSEMSKPYTVLMNCLSQVCRQMILHDDSAFVAYSDGDESDDSMIDETATIATAIAATSTSKYASRIRNQLKPEDIARLACFVPEISALLRLSDEEVGQSVAVPTNTSPLKYALQCFLRAISMPERPLVLCLDDVHWMDHGTLDIIQSLLLDKRLHNFILAGTYRYNEPSSDKHAMDWINKISEAKDFDSNPCRHLEY